MSLILSSLVKTNALQLVMFQLCQHLALMGAISALFFKLMSSYALQSYTQDGVMGQAVKPSSGLMICLS